MIQSRSPSSRLLQAKVRRARKTLEMFYMDRIRDNITVEVKGSVDRGRSDGRSTR